MSLAVVLVSFALCLFLGHGKAQGTPKVAMCISGSSYDWSSMINSRGQDPCNVASYLQVPCLGEANSIVRGLNNSGSFYTGPGGQSDCLCNTVFYSVIEACQLCQYFVPDLEQSWSGWSFNCTDKTNGSYPMDVPLGTAVPAWAYQDVSSTDKFDASKASAVAAEDLPDITPTSSNTSTTTSPTATTSSTRLSSSASATSTPTGGGAADVAGSGKSTNVGAIVGGVVGGVLGILLLGVLVFYLLLRQRNLQRQAQAEASERPVSMATAVDGHQRSLKPVSMISTPSMIYDPNDPRTFPSLQTPPSPSVMRTASPTPSGPPGSVGGYMPHHSFSAMQNYSASSFYGGDHGHSYAASTYKGAPEV
ncbi:hypothetical protein C8T65DRAFT_629903 [Cerioporus squamosus]|nr:hypothetical protein C8T65DRAFT_629903 [Cerioporus squamosus]